MNRSSSLQAGSSPRISDLSSLSRFQLEEKARSSSDHVEPIPNPSPHHSWTTEGFTHEDEKERESSCDRGVNAIERLYSHTWVELYCKRNEEIFRPQLLARSFDGGERRACLGAASMCVQTPRGSPQASSFFCPLIYKRIMFLERIQIRISESLVVVIFYWGMLGVLLKHSILSNLSCYFYFYFCFEKIY